jgi:tetratricopeptide (TPR) repeat protein
MSVARVHAELGEQTGWGSKQAYTLAVFCLVLGIPLGYFFRGSASPESASVSSSATSSSQVQPTGGVAQEAQLGTEEQKATAERAAAPLLERLKTDPADLEAIIRLGNIYFDGQQFPEAIEYYGRALELKPEDPDVTTDLGTAYWYTGDADRAITEFQKSLKIRPAHAGTLFNLGVVRWQGKSDPKGAVQAWEELLKRNPGYPQKQRVLDYIEKAKQHAARG